MDDAIGGWCPSCEGEFQPGITECPDCGVPLLGPDDPRPVEDHVTSEPNDPWGARLDVVAVVAAGALLVLFFASALYALTVDTGGGGDDPR